MQEYINMLSPNLRYISMTDDGTTVTIDVESKLDKLTCPYCSNESSRCHSKYTKTFDDLPMSGKRVVLRIKNRKMFCDNPNCNHRTFSETFDFVERKAKKTNRLIQYIIDASSNMSSIRAQKHFRSNGIAVGKSTICTYLKKTK